MTNLAAELSSFTGTDNYTRVSPFFRTFYSTDGVMFLAESAKCFWLLDVIGSYLPRLRGAGETFAVATITKYKNGNGCTFTLDNGNDGIEAPRVKYATQRIPSTDFPFDQLGDSFKLFVTQVTTLDNNSRPVPGYLVMLPSEY